MKYESYADYSKRVNEKTFGQQVISCLTNGRSMAEVIGLAALFIAATVLGAIVVASM